MDENHDVSEVNSGNLEKSIPNRLGYEITPGDVASVSHDARHDAPKSNPKTTRKPRKRKGKRTHFKRRKEKGRYKPAPKTGNQPEIGTDDAELFECTMPDDEERAEFLNELHNLKAESEKEMQIPDMTWSDSPQRVPFDASQISTINSEGMPSTSGLSLKGGFSVNHASTTWFTAPLQQHYCSSQSLQDIAQSAEATPSGSQLGPRGVSIAYSDSIRYLQSPAGKDEPTSTGSFHTSDDNSCSTVVLPPENAECQNNPVDFPVLNVTKDALAKFRSMLPQPWVILADRIGFHCLYLSSQHPRGLQREIALFYDGSVKIAVHGEALMFADDIVQSVALSPIQFNLSSVEEFCERGVSIAKKLTQYDICVGANNTEYESVWGNSQNCYIDNNSCKENSYSRTCRSVTCPKLILRDFGRIKCESCNALGKQLKRKLKFASSDTVHPKTPNIFLSQKQLLHKVELQQEEIRKKEKQIDYLFRKIERIWENEGVELDQNLSSDLQDILSNAELSPSQKMFLEEQLLRSQISDARANR